MQKRKAIDFRYVTNLITKKRMKRAAPFVVGGLAVGGAVWLVARNWRTISDGVKSLLALDEKSESGRYDVLDNNKPYPVEHTSKKHSKSHAQFKDIQKITHV